MGEIKFKTRLLLTNCSPWQSFFTAPAPTTPALPLTSQVQISPLFPSESPIDMEMNFSTTEERCKCTTAILLSTSERLLICIYTKARRDILEMLQFYPHFPTVLPVPSHRNHREGSGPCSCLTVASWLTLVLSHEDLCGVMCSLLLGNVSSSVNGTDHSVWSLSHLCQLNPGCN